MLCGGGMKYYVQRKFNEYNFPVIIHNFYNKLLWASDYKDEPFNINDSLMLTLKIQCYRLLHHYFEMLNINDYESVKNVFIPKEVEDLIDVNCIYYFIF